MIIKKVKCCECNLVFDPESAPVKGVLVDSGPGYSYYENYPVCPDCGCEDLEELEQISEYCDDIDCWGDCENCELKKELDEEARKEESNGKD